MTGRLLAVWKKTPRVGRWGVLGLLLLELAHGGARTLAPDLRTRARDEASRRAALVESRWSALVEGLQRTADRVAALPDLRPALRGDQAALVRLFTALDAIHTRAESASPEPVAVGVHRGPLDPLAWAGRVNDMRFVGEMDPVRRTLVVLVGRVTTTAVAVVPIADEAGGVLGVVSAEVPLAVRRHIRNDQLRDFDVLSDGLPPDAVVVRYRDILEVDPAPPEAAAAGPRPGEEVRGALRSPDGEPLASYVVSGEAGDAPPLGHVSRSLLGLLLGGLALVGLARAPLGSPWLRLTAAAVFGRLLFVAYGGTGLGTGPGGVLAPETYASPVLAALTRSPLDLLLTTFVVAAAAAGIVSFVAARAGGGAGSPLRALVAGLVSLPLLGGTFFLLADTVANTSIDLAQWPLLPASAGHLVLHAAVLLILVAGFLGLLAVCLFAGRWPARRGQRWVRLAIWGGIALGAYRLWPRGELGLPLVPVLLLFLMAAGVSAGWDRLRRFLDGGGPGAYATLGGAGVVAASALLYPSVVHYSEKGLRAQIEEVYAPLVLQQPDWQEFLLTESLRRIDAMRLLEEPLEEPLPPGIEELAFAVWSETDLAAFGLTSAVEIHDDAGRVLSRFALGLSSIGQRPVPASATWEIGWDRRGLASAQRRVRYAARRLVYDGAVHGAVHVYLGDDLWNLPFVEGRDPYPTLFRTSPPGGTVPRGVTLTAYDRSQAVVFSSADRPPVLSEPVVRRVQQSPGGVWVTLPVEEGLHHVFLFTDRTRVYGLSFERLDAGRYAADIIESAGAMGLLALGGLLAFLLARTLLGYTSLSLGSVAYAVGQRFWLRLFVAFVSLAVVPVGILEVVVRRVVAAELRDEGERQSLELAAVAQRAVEDASFFQRRDVPAGEPLSDAALVWVAGLIRNDLDVFQGGVLLASSKRELYASGLLPPRVSGSAHRTLVVEGRPHAAHTERIGAFAYRVVSVPVRLGSPEPAVLSIPLGLREREVQSVLADLDRSIRLASLVFLGVAALLAHSIARRISVPIRDLTVATRRVAEGDLEARVAVRSRDELRELVDSFNTMAGDLRRQRQELERSNRLAAWAEMARQVAHEVKNPLTPIQLSAEHLRRVFREGGADFAQALETCVDTILKQVRTLRGIATEFSAFARPPAATLARVDLREIVSRAVQPYQATLPVGVTLEVASAENLPPVLVDPRLFERAVVNLVENAVQAVGGGGTIGVRLEVATGAVHLHVQDDGPGMDDAVRARAFEPFFSTKTSGSGLGLALVKKIAEDHGGGVALDSEAGRGTRVSLWIPTADPEVPASEG